MAITRQLRACRVKERTTGPELRKIWLQGVFMLSPQSCTATHFAHFDVPVFTSTETSDITARQYFASWIFL
jgi:hypothetical protein